MANTLSNTVLNRNLDIQNENSSHREKNEAENFINDIKLNRENNPLQVKSKFKKAISNTLDHCVTQGFLMVFTLFALFGDDLRLLSSPKSQEDAFNFMASLCFLIFTVEIILSTISKENYYRSFFFWLDIIATISLIADIGWVWKAIIGYNENEDSDYVNESNISHNELQDLLGPRTIRLIRIFRVIRLIRIVKLYKLAQEKRSIVKETTIKRAEIHFRGPQAPVLIEAPEGNKRKFEVDLDEKGVSISQSFSSLSNSSESFSDNQVVEPSTMLNQATISIQNNEAQPNEEKPIEKKIHKKVEEENKLGQHLADVTIQRVIILVLSTMLTLPLFYSGLYQKSYQSSGLGLELINEVLHDREGFNLAWDTYIATHKDLDDPLIYLQVKNRKLWKTDVNIADLRLSEILVFTIDHMDSDFYYWTVAVFDMRYTSRREAGLNMAKTAFICIIVAIASIVLTKDTRKLLLKPIEKMINKVKGISNNPLRSVQSEEYESYLQELRSRYLKTLKSENRPIEVIILEETVQKIGALLALGFGESGSEIIAYNIERSGGHIDPLIPGRRTYCIFGSCEILDFSAISNILSKEITYFVNEISFIVHNIADQFSGYANRNTGENMIIVWKFPDDCIDIDPFTEQKRGLNNNPYIKEIADMAVIGFVKILIEVSKNQRLLKYKNHDKIALKMPNYEVKLNLSLHQGWGIEGAIGSEFKLDADYISPDLNIASRLNSLTNDYKVPIIISGDLEKICSNVTRSKFRKIDRIKLNSTKDPKALYTCYLNLNLIGHPPIQNTAEANNSKRLRVLGRLTRDKLKELTRKGNYKTSKLWSEDYDLRMATIDLNPEFTEVYNEALNFYIHGDWKSAQLSFLQALNLKEDDGVIQFLLKYISENECKDSWKGYREI